jgi:hypothetical protein
MNALGDGAEKDSAPKLSLEKVFVSIETYQAVAFNFGVIGLRH